MTLADLNDRAIAGQNQAVGRLHRLLIELAGRGAWNPRSIGRYLRRNRDRFVVGLSLHSGGEARAGLRWRVERSQSW